MSKQTENFKNLVKGNPVSFIILESNLQLASIPHESVDVQSIEGENIVDKYEVRQFQLLS